MIDKKEKKTPHLIFDYPPFWNSHPFWNFDHSPVNYELETSKKRAVPTTLTQKSHHWMCIVIRLEKRHKWPKFAISVSPAFTWSEAVSHRNSPNIRGVQVPESSSLRDTWSSRQKNFYELHLFVTLLLLKRFCC